MKISEWEFVEKKSVILSGTDTLIFIYLYACENGHTKEIKFMIESNRECDDCLKLVKLREWVTSVNYGKVKTCFNCLHSFEWTTYGSFESPEISDVKYYCKLNASNNPSIDITNTHAIQINYVCDKWEEIKKEEN